MSRLTFHRLRGVDCSRRETRRRSCPLPGERHRPGNRKTYHLPREDSLQAKSPGDLSEKAKHQYFVRRVRLKRPPGY